MILIIIAAIALVVGIVLLCLGDFDALAVCGGVLAVCGGIALFISLVMLPLNYQEHHDFIAQYEAMKTTLTTLRANGESIENAAIQLEIIDMNKRIARAQYYRTTIWRTWIPKEIDALVPLK